MAHKLSSSERREVKKVVCPRCGVWIGKECMHTKGSKAGQECDPHPERIKLSAKIDNLSGDTKRKIKEVEDAVPEKSHKKAKDKLTPQQHEVIDVIEEKLGAMGKSVEFVGPVTVGPIVSTYRFFPVGRTRVNHLEGMAKDFSVILGSEETIVVKRMPGETAVGVFVPNKERTIIRLSDTLPNVASYLQKTKPSDGHRPIPLNFGVTHTGEPFVDDLTVQPHLLMAGSTDAGKSTLANGFLLSMLWNMSPRELRLLIADTKKVDFKPYYRNIPHLQMPIAGDIYETMRLLEYCLCETERRLQMFEREGGRNIHEYNTKHLNKLEPYIVLYIDEIADIMGDQVKTDEAKANAKKLGALVGRCRAAGIYVIAGTQRPSVNIVKGSIKANFPSRVAFRLPSHQDSRTIINTKGAENLMKKGDMFYQSSQSSELRRIHAPWTELQDVKTLIEAIIAREDNEKQRVSEEESERIAMQQEGSGKPIDQVSQPYKKPN